MTLLQGAGVHSRSFSTVTYSRASVAKPPRPLKNSSGGTLRIASNEGSPCWRVAGARAGSRGAKTRELRAQRTPGVAKHGARGGLQQFTRGCRQGLAVQGEHAAAQLTRGGSTEQ